MAPGLVRAVATDGHVGAVGQGREQIDDRRADLEQRRRDLDDALKELDAFEESCRADLDRLR